MKAWAWTLPFLLLLAMTAAGEPHRLAPLTGVPPYPPDNPPTPEKIALGEELFFEQMLSGDKRRSCSTCHKPELYFTDGFSRAWGLNESELRRKTPTVLNVGWQRSMFADGRVKTLEEQASKPLENPLEMDMNPAEAAERLASDPYYRKRFEKVFPGEPITFDLVARALSSYERTLISLDSDYDRHLSGDAEALKPEARRGLDLFSGKAGCIRCHHGPLLTDHEIHYTGVPEMEGDNDAGKKYKTPSLRDAMRRYSFMHNGAYLKIEQVLDHYVGGGQAPDGIVAEVKPVELSADERKDLVAFLRSLNGRVESLLERSPDARDVFSVTRTPQSGEDEAAASDSGPVLDPAYVKKRP